MEKLERIFVDCIKNCNNSLKIITEPKEQGMINALMALAISNVIGNNKTSILFCSLPLDFLLLRAKIVFDLCFLYPNQLDLFPLPYQCFLVALLLLFGKLFLP